MKIKAVDIARELGISKATVSLALNNKPGVNKQTRQMIFECKERLEKNEKEPDTVKNQDIKVIKVVFVIGISRVVYETDLKTDVLAVFDKESKKMGYSIGITYVDLMEDDMEPVINECNMNSVAGVILFGTEMLPSDYDLFRKINKPMIVYDNDFENCPHHRVCIDNISGIGMGVEYLIKRGCTQIRYLANETDCYNFKQRREGFKQAMIKKLEFHEKLIIPMGWSIDTVYESMKKYLQEGNLPDAFIMENYQVSIGVMKAMRELRIKIPQDISLIGVDEIPSYSTGDCKLTTIKIAHTDRASMVMSLLQREIQESISTKFKVMSDCQLIEGNSVR